MLTETDLTKFDTKSSFSIENTLLHILYCKKYQKFPGNSFTNQI